MKRTIVFLLLTGCLGALGDKPEATPLRYFSPEHATVETNGARASVADAPVVRLGRVTSSASLRSRIVHRESAYEVGLYETLRWTDDPEVYVRRALERALYDDGAARDAATGNMPALDIEVIAFEERVSAHGRGGRVEVRYELRDDRGLVASGSATSIRDADTNTIESIVSAIESAMNDVTIEIVRKTLAALRTR
jgi:ABC-type uncharacterized transport system auxiliary subunit